MNSLQILGSIPINNEQVVDPACRSDKERRIAVRSSIDGLMRAMAEFYGNDRGIMDKIDDDGLKHHLMDGVYIRELFIPKGSVIVSKLHRYERFWIIAAGEVTFRTEYGARHVKAPYTEIVEPWSRVALYAHEDTLWFAVCKRQSDSDDISVIESELLAEEFPEEEK